MVGLLQAGRFQCSQTNSRGSPYRSCSPGSKRFRSGVGRCDDILEADCDRFLDRDSGMQDVRGMIADLTRPNLVGFTADRHAHSAADHVNRLLLLVLMRAGAFTHPPKHFCQLDEFAAHHRAARIGMLRRHQVIGILVEQNARHRNISCSRTTDQRQTTIMTGFSIRILNAPSSSAPSTPSTARWSVESVADIITATSILPFFTIALSSAVPTARIVACGGLITAAKSLMPYIPRFDTALVPP